MATILLFCDSLMRGDLGMAAPRRVIELAFSEQELADLTRVSRSRTEPASRVERARMLLAYRETPSLYAAGRAIGVTHQTVERCLRRAQEFGIMAALDDSPRPGRDRTITSEARAFVVDLACRKPKDLGIRMNCGRRGCWRGMCENRARRRAMRAWPSSLRERCARYWPRTRSSRTRCVAISNAAIPNSPRKWRRCCVSIARSRC